MTEDALSSKQALALELVIAGKYDREVAEIVGVTRQQVNRWRNHDRVFMEALRARRVLIREHHIDRINQLIDRSLDTLEEELECGPTHQRVSIAKFLLRLSGMSGYAKSDIEKNPKQEFIDVLEDAIRDANVDIQARYAIEGKPDDIDTNG